MYFWFPIFSTNMYFWFLNFQYFNHPETYWAAEPESMTCKVGDIVKIQKLPESVTPITTHKVCEHIFKIGEIVDPVTGRRCRGTKFIDEENRKLSKEKYEKESGSILQ